MLKKRISGGHPRAEVIEFNKINGLTSSLAGKAPAETQENRRSTSLKGEFSARR
jgi:hypothetical protein